MKSNLCLVTGGSGFIGKHLVSQLLSKGYAVRVLDLVTGSIPKVTYIQGSILDKTLVKDALKGVDCLFHLAANPHLWARNNQIFEEVNHLGTEIVLTTAVDRSVPHILHTSTEAILGSYLTPSSQLIDESVGLPPLAHMPGPYTRSKWLADQVASSLINKGAPINIVYPSTPVGAGDEHFTAPTQMIFDFMSGKHPAYLECVLNLVAVEDVAAGMRLALEKGEKGERYILGGENLLLSQILSILHQHFGIKIPHIKIPYPLAMLTARISAAMSTHITHNPPVASPEGVRLAAAKLRFDVSKAREKLGMPQSGVTQGILSTVHWLKREGYLK